MFRIAIIGGGLGGLFAALCIHHHCAEYVKIDVYEQAPEYSEIGAGVGIGPNAAKLFEKLGLLDQAVRVAGKRENVWLSFRRYDTGEEVHTVYIPKNGNTTQLPMHRADLLDLLVRAIRERGAAQLHTKKRCQKLEDRGKLMHVTFEDGTTASANLVVGADGIHSAVRSHYIHESPQYGGMVLYRGLCPVEDIKDEWNLSTFAALWMAPGKHFLTFPISNNKIINVVAFVSTPWDKVGDVRESWTLAGDKKAVQDEFNNFAPLVQSVIKKMNTNPLKWVLFDRKSTSQWIFSNGKVALLGDAAHAMCPHQGAGAGQSMEDGYVLGRALDDYFRHLDTSCQYSLQDALHLYQSIRYPRSEKVQVTSRQAGDLYELRTPEVTGLSFEESLPVVKAMLQDRMKWIWSEDLDQLYETARRKSQGPLERL
ncbi:hypothetical protein BDV59DRAFT_196286 [Aspergillus ambiguus]|uniref:uncharacterized protein n=1 Tax=Aspergillus ambiguus TaxID=176160 RepID=UPI003CCE3188